MQGRHPLQTSDALGAAATHLGPQALTLVVWWHTGLGLPFGTVQRILRTQYGLSITRGAPAQVCARVATREGIKVILLTGDNRTTAVSNRVSQVR